MTILSGSRIICYVYVVPFWRILMNVHVITISDYLLDYSILAILILMIDTPDHLGIVLLGSLLLVSVI